MRLCGSSCMEFSRDHELQRTSSEARLCQQSCRDGLRMSALPQISIPASNAQSIKQIVNVRFTAGDSVQKIFSIRCLFLRCFYDANAIV